MNKTNIFVFNEITPRIGETIERFKISLGEPVSASNSLYSFFIPGSKPYLLCMVVDGIVTQITWEPPPEYNLKKLAANFLPKKSYLLKENERKVYPLLNGDAITEVDLFYWQDENGQEYAINFMIGETDFAISLEKAN